jgi:hypothetical protein
MTQYTPSPAGQIPGTQALLTLNLAIQVTQIGSPLPHAG